MKHRFTIAILALLVSFSAYSGPAKKGTVFLVQPDGTTFGARITGDEFMKTVTTSAGHSVTQDGDGWWCYALYDGEGRKSSSGCRVGQNAPADVMSMSRDIPFEKLIANARSKRLSVTKDEEPILARVMRHKGIDTKSSDNQQVEKHGLIILAQFSNKKFKHDRQAFVDLLEQKGYSLNGADGCAKEYFDAQFNGAINFTFDISPIVTLPYDVAYYGKNDGNGDDYRPASMAMDACECVDEDIDFSKYDDDGDGEVDNVFIFFAGGDEAEGAGEDCIWSHAWYIKDGAGKDLFLDGKRINRYACTAELSRRYTGSSYNEVLAGIGTFCHEYFHTFGIPDLYDTDYGGSGGMSAGLWAAPALMDSGNQNNDGNTPPYLSAVEREYLGLTEPEMITSDGTYNLEPVHLNGKYYRLDTDYENEYYLFEYRSGEGWDRYIGGSGMLVYHIDRSDRNSGKSEVFNKILTAHDRWETANEVNARASHQCADLVECDARPDGFSGYNLDPYYAALNDIRGVFFTGSGTTSILPDGKPGIRYWSGEEVKTSITNIRKTADGMSFNVVGYTGRELPPNVASCTIDAFADAAIIRFESDRPFEGEAEVSWGRTDGSMETARVTPYEPGKYSLTLENLESGNRTYGISILFNLNNMYGDEYKDSFMTKKRPSVEWPYIYMGSVVTNSDGTLPAGTKLPLRVYNAADAAEITWTFDGSEITAGGDGYYTVTSGGELKAHIIRKDGSEEVILKVITIGEEEQR